MSKANKHKESFVVYVESSSRLEVAKYLEQISTLLRTIKETDGDLCNDRGEKVGDFGFHRGQ